MAPWVKCDFTEVVLSNGSAMAVKERRGVVAQVAAGSRVSSADSNKLGNVAHGPETRFY